MKNTLEKKQIASAKSATVFGPMEMKISKNALPEADVLIFVDGGLVHQDEEMGPAFSVGDGDSCSGRELSLKFSPEKDFTDLKGALGLLENASTVFLTGFLGGRRDHELCNLGEISRWSEASNAKKVLCNLDNEVFCIKGKDFEFKGKGVFTLFSFEKSEIDLHGDVKYSVERGKEILPFSGHGLSNEINGKMIISSSKPVLILSKDLEHVG